MRTIRIMSFLLLALLLGEVSLAQSARHTLDIKPQPIKLALRDLGEQTGLQILFRAEDVAREEVTTPQILGEMSPNEALDRMLEKAPGLKYEWMNAHTVLISAREEGKAASMSERGAMRMAQTDTPVGESDSSATAKGGADQQNTPNPAENPQQEPLEEITVTAQKRIERLQDVPISISVLNGADLDRSRAEGLSEQLNRVPGVTTVPGYQGGATQVAVRGSSAATALFSGSNPIAYYVDGVPFALVRSAVTPDMSPYDLDRVEVLRGPQGTLYGASALNGVVRILTHGANLNEFELKARTSASSTEDGGENYRADLALNIPLIEGKLGARAVVGYQDLSGWVDRPGSANANDSEVANFRLRLRAEPTSRLSLDWSSWFTRGDSAAPPYSLDDGTFTTTSRDEPFSNDFDQHRLAVEYDFGRFSLASTTGFLEYDNPGELDLIPIEVPWTLFTGIESEIFSQEFLLTSTGAGPWRWTLGALYRHGKDHTVQTFTDNATGEQPADAREPYEFWDRSESLAVFGELTKVLLDGALEVTGGLRYFEDEVPGKEGFVGQPPLVDGEASFDKVTPRVILAWHPSTQTMAYASYSQGFRSGFDQYDVAKTILGLPPLKPDTLTNYEVGMRGSMLERRFQYDAALYFIDWKDVQHQFDVVVDDIPGTANVNAGNASGLGVDLGLELAVTDHVDLALSTGWNDLTFDQSVLSGTEIFIHKGDRLNSSPELTAAVAADCTFPIGSSGFKGQLTTSANYISEQQVESFLGEPVVAVGDDLVFARVSFAIESPSHWRTTLFVDNLTNEDGTALAQVYSPLWSVRARPRTMGLQFEYRFTRQ